MKKGAFIVIDGIDGAGKSTQIALLKKLFGRRAVFAFDPGGTRAGNAQRELLLREGKQPPFTTLLMFLAARAALVEEVIAPTRRRGKLVICDRYDSSTYAYQIHAGKRPEFRAVVHALTDSLEEGRPDAYIILDMAPERARKRLSEAGKQLDVYERKPLAYHRAVRAGFKTFPPRGARVHFVNADRPAAAVFEEVRAIVEKYAK